MAKNNSKVVKRVIGGSLLVIAGVTGYYQYEYNKLQNNSKVPVVVATKNISESESLNTENTQIVMREKKSLSDGYLSDMSKLADAVATSKIFKNESVNINRTVTAEEYKKKNLILVSIKGTQESHDTFVGYDVKPFDVVDLLFFDKNGVYEGQPYMTGQTVYDLKSVDGVSYANRGDGYKAAYALIWVPKDKAEEINQRQEQGGYFKFQLHREKASEK